MMWQIIMAADNWLVTPVTLPPKISCPKCIQLEWPLIWALGFTLDWLWLWISHTPNCIYWKLFTPREPRDGAWMMLVACGSVGGPIVEQINFRPHVWVVTFSLDGKQFAKLAQALFFWLKAFKLIRRFGRFGSRQSLTGQSPNTLTPKWGLLKSWEDNSA